jgi:hypothetical protein
MNPWLSADTVAVILVMVATMTAFIVATWLNMREMARQRAALARIKEEIRAATVTFIDQDRRRAMAEVKVEEEGILDLLNQVALDASGARLEVDTILSVADVPVPALVASGADGMEVIFTPDGAAYRQHVLAPARKDSRDVAAFEVSPANSSLVVDEELRQAWGIEAFARGIHSTTLPRRSAWDVLILPNGREA